MRFPRIIAPSKGLSAPIQPVTTTTCQNNGVMGALFTRQQWGTVPLYRLKKGLGVTLRHLSTLDAQERTPDGFMLENIQGYVCPP